MAIISREKYSQSKIEKIKDYLRIYYQKGTPIDYEIVVDGFKAVRRTSDPEMFDMFENFVGGDTNSIEILLFTGSSNNNDKHIFTMKEETKEESLNGIEVDSKIQQAKKDWDFDRLKEENEKLKKEINELEEELEAVEKEKADILAGQSPLKGVLGEIGSTMVESFIRRNPQILSTIPGAESLAGIIEEDNQRKAREARQPRQTPSATDVSFTPVSENEMSEEDKNAITFVGQLKESYTSDEFNRVLLILQHLAQDKSKIEETITYLNIKQ